MTGRFIILLLFGGMDEGPLNFYTELIQNYSMFQHSKEISILQFHTGPNNFYLN